ncbi:hypothetical protein [uncultured Ruegeria sp.]|uniref:hypothetical protein n=1 Tax=uncultured Ruegeria sp. TaxID=259304 RepID=UPI002620A241|nr:hypothetical protein [uncultured Ruegeria sp.]
MTQALKTLHDKVEARTASYSDFSNYFKPVLTDTEHVHWGTIAKSADSGSLDAAKALMDACTGWVIQSLVQRHGGVWVAHIWEVDSEGWHQEGMRKIEVWNECLARAILLGHLRALLSQAEGE